MASLAAVNEQEEPGWFCTGRRWIAISEPRGRIVKQLPAIIGMLLTDKL